jgi:membrane-associated phospholipid phosphatase
MAGTLRHSGRPAVLHIEFELWVATLAALRRRLVLLLLCLAFAALAALVAAGAFTGVDQYATTHLMPGLEPSKPGTVFDALLPIGDRRDVWNVAADLWLYPASAPLSSAIVGIACAALWRRGRRDAARLWGAAFVAGTAIEIVVKELLERPALYAVVYGSREHVVGFDHALPSGHTIRSFLLAAVVLAVWPRLGRAAAAWAATVAPILVVAGWHTPTDVLAGLLLAAALALLAHDLERPRVDDGAGLPGLRHDREPRPVEA